MRVRKPRVVCDELMRHCALVCFDCSLVRESLFFSASLSPPIKGQYFTVRGDVTATMDDDFTEYVMGHAQLH